MARTVSTTSSVEQAVGGLLPDAHGPVALHVAVAAHRAHPSSRLADGAPQQQEVHDLADGGHRVGVLGQAHGPAHDGARRGEHVVRRRLDLRAVEAGGLEDVLPGHRPQVPGQGVEALAVRGHEPVVDRPGTRVGGVALDQDAIERLEQGQVAVQANLQEAVGQRGPPAQQAPCRLRVGEGQQPGLGQRVHRDDAGAVALGPLEGREHPGVVGARVLADHDQ
jgi:hypothetical protein